MHANNSLSAPGLVHLDARPAEIELVVQRAAEAANSFGQISNLEKADFLCRIAEGIESVRPKLIDAAHSETGLPLPRLEGETTRTTAQLRQFAHLVREGSWVDARIDTAEPKRQPVPRPDLRRMLQPIGPVAVFGASNFPLAFSVAGGDTASALAAGNPVIVKGHPGHPVTGEITAAAINAAVQASGLAPGVFGFVHGSEPAVARSLVQHPLLAAVGFTGSARVGRILMDLAATRPVPIPVFAEMASVNPVFLLSGALRDGTDELATGLFKSVSLGVGQFCTKPGIVFGVASLEWDTFCEKVGALARVAELGRMLNPGIASAFHNNVSSLVDVDWIAQGPTHVATVDANQFRAHPELLHEIFGPFVLLVTATSIHEMCALAENVGGQLTASIHMSPADQDAARGLMAILQQKVGRLVANGFPTGVEVAPAMQHGGPYPASSDVRFTSVGTAAILRFARPICYQGFSDTFLPPELRDSNPLGIMRTLNGEQTKRAIIR